MKGHPLIFSPDSSRWRNLIDHSSFNNLAQLKAGLGLDGVQQFGLEGVGILEIGQLEQVHTRAGCGQPIQLAANVLNTKRRVQFLE